MSFDPTLPTTLDRIRLIVGDTSNDVATEWFLDDTYEAEIANYTNWKLAAAAMAEAVAVKIEQEPRSFTATGDMAVSWGDMTRSLRLQATRLRAEAAAEDAASGNGITSVALSRDGTSAAAEYRASAYRGLRR
jgi:hypothetical protein